MCNNIFLETLVIGLFLESYLVFEWILEILFIWNIKNVSERLPAGVSWFLTISGSMR